MNIVYYSIIGLLIFSWLLFNLFLFLLNKKVIILEKKIIDLFQDRNDFIPSLYDVTRDYVTKHDDVFKEVMNLRKNNLSKYNWWFLEKISQEVMTHHEINFIFKVINKNQKIQNNHKYLTIKDNFIENGSMLWKKIELYKNISKKLNRLLDFKNFTIIGIFINIEKRDEF